MITKYKKKALELCDFGLFNLKQAFLLIINFRSFKSSGAPSRGILSAWFCDSKSCWSWLWEWNVQDINVCSVKHHAESLLHHRANQAYWFSLKPLAYIFSIFCWMSSSGVDRRLIYVWYVTRILNITLNTCGIPSKLHGYGHVDTSLWVSIMKTFHK